MHPHFNMVHVYLSILNISKLDLRRFAYACWNCSYTVVKLIEFRPDTYFHGVMHMPDDQQYDNYILIYCSMLFFKRGGT